MKVLVTGMAGFIGFHLVDALIRRGDEVIGIDNLNAYYDLRFKYGRLAQLGFTENSKSNAPQISTYYPKLMFIRMDLTDRERLDLLIKEGCFDVVVNLAAQAGVRYSLINPHSYIQSNVVGFVNLLEACRQANVKHLVYASSSSVYGTNKKIPYAESDRVDEPASLYAVTKRTDELLASVYGKLYRLPTTGLRFFTVYGPYGRPDMAPFLFMDAIQKGKPIRVFNNGQMLRDFTYIDDIVQGVLRVMNHAPQQSDPAKIYNIGHSTPVKLSDFIETIEQVIGRKAICKYEVMQPGDVPCTYADTTRLEKEFGFRPDTSLQDGIRKLYAWYVDFMPYLEQEDKQ